ncbi:hypothetical protein B0H13DRAFT_2369543 [Mycena leptocephala]|nr:hypothetical protein B0H13DRAFT_2369543 [Mycena leptocephala]
MPPRKKEPIEVPFATPIINRATSTRAQSKQKPAMSQGSRASSLQPSSSKLGKKKVTVAPTGMPNQTASSLTKINPPTAASASRSVLAPTPALPPFGSSAPCLPFHMNQKGVRAPRMIEEPDKDNVVRGNEPLPAIRGFPVLEAVPTIGAATLASTSTLPMSTPLPTSSKNTLSEESELEIVGSTDVGKEDESARSETRSSSSSRRSQPRLDNESVTAALSLRSALQNPSHESGITPAQFFTHFGRSIELFDETIEVAVQRYHGVYDPNLSTQEDPLLPYGAIHGEIPDTDPASSLALRDTVVRYDYPSLNFEWTDMSSLVQQVVQLDAATVLLVPTASPESQERFYSLNLTSLSMVGHAVVGIQQILQALTIFLCRDPATSFYLDPSYGFLHMLESCSSQKELRFALSTLQLRLQRADIHVRSYLLSIRETLTNEQFSEQVSSVDSTISEVRREFGGQHPRKELYRLLNRDDYGQCASVIDDATRRRMLEILNETLARGTTKSSGSLYI